MEWKIQKGSILNFNRKYIIICFGVYQNDFEFFFYPYCEIEVGLENTWLKVSLNARNITVYCQFTDNTLYFNDSTIDSKLSIKCLFLSTHYATVYFFRIYSYLFSAGEPCSGNAGSWTRGSCSLSKTFLHRYSCSFHGWVCFL